MILRFVLFIKSMMMIKLPLKWQQIIEQNRTYLTKIGNSKHVK